MEHNHQYEDDLFESQIMSEIQPSEQQVKQAVQKAFRCSSMARGVEEGSIEEVLPLKKQVSEAKTFEQTNKTLYGRQGILLKQSPGFFGSWEQRYVVLKGQRFIYKEKSSPISPTAGVLNFNLLSCEVAVEIQENQYSNFRILIRNSEKQFVFKGKTQKQTQEWMTEINLAVKRSEGFRKNYSYLAHYPRFWRKDYESASQFKTTAQAGDILLFRGLKSSSVMQRAVTRDEFDHIAVILINEIGEPLILEANGGLGVGLCSWSKFMSRKWWAQYDLVVHRKLQVLRTDGFLQKIQKFAQTNIGKEYKFSIGDYLFYRNSTVQKDHQFYFCSSLVAKLYKRLELLPPEKSCKQYLPSSFSEKQELSLKIDGAFGYAYLQSQKIIVFQQEKNQ